MDRKKIIIIASVIIAVILILIAGWYFFFRQTPAQIPPGEFPGGEFPSEGAGGAGGGGGAGAGGGGLPMSEKVGLYQLVANAASGGSFVSTTTAVKYFDQSTGNLYEIKIDGSETRRLSNSTILRSFDVLWSPDASKFIIKYAEPNNYGADAVKFFSAGLSTSTPSVEGEFLPTNTIAAISSPAEDKIFYLAQGAQSAIGVISDYANKTKKQIFTSNFGEYNLSWPNQNTILLTTKPSGNTEGFLYALNSQTGAFSRILSNIKGLTALMSPGGEQILYSQSEGKALRTLVTTTKGGATTSLSPTTLPEKCVWSAKEKSIIYCAVPKKIPSQTYPDAWYQGQVSFEDALWKIDTASNTSEMIKETNLDAINMQLDYENKYILFTNKKDLSLWVFKLAE